MRKILSIILSFGLLFQQSGLVYAVGELNLVNYLSQAKSAIVQPDQFRPPQLRYISYDIKSNDFKLLLDKGGPKLNEPSNSLNSLNSLNSSTPKLNGATQELFNYFLIGLALPNDTFWVNLRPDAADNIIDPLLEKTDIGKIFLEADLQLKKDTASFTSPQNPEGKQYWDKLYKKAGELFGTENITIPTITRPWIVPNEVIVRETDDSAYIYKATLKVMLEADYLSREAGSRLAFSSAGNSSQQSAGQKAAVGLPIAQATFSNQQYNFNDPRLKELNQYSTQLIKDTIIPKLTQEVNSSKRYAQLRQVYYSLVLSRWFKMKYQGKPGQYPELIDRQNLTNLASKQAWDKQTYFSQYQESFAKGEYNLKETVVTPFGQSIRSYISGGLQMTFGSTGVDSPIAGINVSNRADVTKALTGQSSAIVGSPLSAEEFIRAVKVINDAASYDKKISYEDAFYKIIELVPLIKEGERISPQRITDDLFYIIHNGKPRPTFDKSWLELTIGKRKYTRDSFLNMVVQQLQKSKSDQEKRIKDDIISAISGLAVMLGKGLSKYEKDMEDIRNGKDYSEDLKKLNKIGSDVLNTIENPLGRKEFDASLVSAGERLSIIIKYNSFLSATDKAMEIIAAGSPLTIEERVELLLQRLPSFMQKKLSEDKVLSLLKKVTEAKYYFAGIRRGTFSSNLAEATLLEAKLREAKEQGRMAASPLGKINKRIKELERDIAERQNRITQIQDDISVNEKKIKDLRAQISAAANFQLFGFGKDKRELEEQNERNHAAISRIQEHISEMSGELRKLREEAKKQGTIVGSPLTIKKFKDEALKILRDLGDDFLEESIRMEYINRRKNLIKYTKQIIPKIERKIARAISNKEGSQTSANMYSAQARQEFAREVRNLNRGTGYSTDFASTDALEKQALQASLESETSANAKSDLESAKESLLSLIKALSSSSLTNIESASSGTPGLDLKNGFGGIDLTDRMLNIKLERVGSFADLKMMLPGISNVEAIDLDKEFEQIQAMVSSSIRPSDTRILEFAAACYYKGEFDRRLTQVSSCVKAAHLADELLGRESSPALRLATMLPDALYGG